MKQNYDVTGWTKFGEEDDYKEGCLPETGFSHTGGDTFSAHSIDGIVEKVLAFTGFDKKDDPVLLDSCDEPGRIDIQGLENADGIPASAREIKEWKRGKIKLWSVTYTFDVEKVTRKKVKLAA